MTFSDRLKQLRLNKNISQKALGDIIGLTDRAIRNFESGKQTPNMIYIIALSKYFGETTDYLLGLSDVRNIDNQTAETMPVNNPSDEEAVALKPDASSNKNTGE